MEKEIEKLIIDIINISKTIWPETVYGYKKIYHRYHSGKRGRKGYHTVAIAGPESNGIDITQEEYEINKKQGDVDWGNAFLGKSRQSYYTYGKYIKTNGWKENLRKIFNDILEKAK